ncbi:MAG: hypothetical protein APR53_06935 [Methanoculleus sp. SDB]|nr:MAG: hypothetical protein APR53_06935 [Methanoculleus sp. SDB]
MPDPADDERYARQLPVTGSEGQRILSRSHALVAGAGGLGSTIAACLAGAGFGHIRIVDSDRIEKHNLNRQILYRDEDIGRFKADVAGEELCALNPRIRVEGICEVISQETIRDLAAGMDLILDGMDNFPTRYILNGTALEYGIPFVHGGVNGFYGQVSTIIPYKTPCLRCIVPVPPPAGPVPIIGVTTGIIGCIEATEAIKLRLGIGGVLAGRLLFWDGLRSETDTLVVDRAPRCIGCGGEHASAGRGGTP